jgi:hypothetical protein
MTHLDDEIDELYAEEMNRLARMLDMSFNDPSKPRKVCFVLLTTEFGDIRGRVNYISNGRREDLVNTMKHLIARFEGQPDIKGHA